jgi:hypothetical protein
MTESGTRWLADHNVSFVIVRELRRLGVGCATTAELGWASLRNGQLVAAAVNAGFGVILTRDVRFQDSARHV